MEPIVGLIFYLLFFLWELILLIRYLRLIVEKTYVPKLKLKKEEMQMEYLPEEIIHMISIDKGNYFSESMSKVNSVILLELFRNSDLKTEIKDDKLGNLKISKRKDLPIVEQEILNLFQSTEKKNQNKEPIKMNQMKWKVFGYQKVRSISEKINETMKENLNKRKFLNKVAFENIERISKELFFNFILLFIIIGITYLSFIPTVFGLIFAVLITLANMVFGFWAKKRISRYTKKGVDELTKIKFFGDALLESLKEAKGETKFEIAEDYYSYAYALRNSKRIYA